MHIIRVECIAGARKRQHNGPVEGGTFWAPADIGVMDLPVRDGEPVCHADLTALLRRCTVWVQRFHSDGTWIEITTAYQAVVIRGKGADHDLIEFYIVPRTANGRRMIHKARWGKGRRPYDCCIDFEVWAFDRSRSQIQEQYDRKGY